jgi:hypothetical protein
MSRTFSDSVTKDSKVIPLLDKLIDKHTESEAYANTMFELGTLLGSLIAQKTDDSYNKITLACTAEDADFLGKGIIDTLEKNGREVLLTVFWNKRFTPSEENNITVAPIIKEFHEVGFKDSHILIIIKSIISSSCVVRTNLTKMINEFEPDRILVVAPVLLKGATENLESEFDSRISEKFEYVYFAIDDQKSPEGMVIPGIGGDVYQRLGFANQDDKNKYIPAIVKQRRSKYAS